MVSRLVLVLALLAGCRDPGITELEGVRDAVCACKTAACGQIAMKRVPTAEVPNNHRSQTIAREMMDCLAKLYEAERPVTGPDDEAVAAPTPPVPTPPAP
ncbi:MAG: hypothetical protein IPQ07_21055 [Myxococcales bacterium]|nr:hypothetical protein [Myxococcales bacterium]